MAEFKFRNINDAFNGLVDFFVRGSTYQGRAWGDRKDKAPIVKETSRNGNVVRIDEPVTITYSHPRERVLFNSARDVNPFGTLMEALYLLAGRNDVEPLAFYTPQFREYSDDGKTLNGAYGYRWREAKSYHFHYPTAGYLHRDNDQLDIIVQHLKAQPNSRRAVLSMWNVESDLLKIGGEKCLQCHGGKEIRRNKETGEIHGRLSYNDELVICPRCGGKGIDPGSKDVACNTQVYFQLRTCGPMGCLGGGYVPTDRDDNTCDICNGKGKFLDITVTNRSNDMCWGLLGANYVTFSVLQEYMAARIGVEVGRYHQFSNNLHAYDWNFKPKEWLAADEAQPFGFHVSNPDDWGAQYRDWTTVPLVDNPETFEHEVKAFVEHFSGKTPIDDLAEHWDEPFLRDVAQPMMIAFALHKVRDYHGAFACAAGIEASDWRFVCEQWLRKRQQAYEKKAVEK